MPGPCRIRRPQRRARTRFREPSSAEERGPVRIAGLGVGVCATPAVEPAGVLEVDGQQGGHRGEEHQQWLDGEEARVAPPWIAVFCLVIDELLREKGPLLGSLGKLRGKPF